MFHIILCKPWAHFLKSNHVGRYFYQKFQGFCPDLQKIKTVGGALAPPAPPPPTPLLFITVSQVISWFIKIDLKQIYWSYSGTQKIQNDFLSFLLLLLRSTLLMNRNKHKFPLPKNWLLPFPCRTVAKKCSEGGLYVCSGGSSHSEIWWKLHRFIVLHNLIEWVVEFCLGG